MAKKRRIRSPHPGVVLIKPKGAYVSHRAKYKDPENGREKRISVPEMGDEARRKWAIELSQTLAERRTAIARGAPIATGLPLKTLIDRYFKEIEAVRSERTVEITRKATNHLENWCARNGVRSGDDLTRERLRAFRASRAAVRKQVRKKGGKENEYMNTREVRLPSTVNTELMQVQAALGYLCDSQLLPKITRVDLEIGLEPYPVPRDPKTPLTHEQIVKLLEACVRHDNETRGGAPITPWVLFMLLTGLRLNEGLRLEWERVDMSAKDDNGARCGQLVIPSRRSKTGIGRVVSFDVSPTVRAMFDVLAVRSGQKGRVWTHNTQNSVNWSLRELMRTYGAPKFSAQTLRVTCASYLTNARGVYGSASAYHSARRCGHSVAIAEKHYLGTVRGIPADARTLEAAMGIEKQAAEVVRALSGAPKKLVKRRAPNQGAPASFGDLQATG